jgi:glutamyl-tRNA synthetase
MKAGVATLAARAWAAISPSPIDAANASSPAKSRRAIIAPPPRLGLGQKAQAHAASVPATKSAAPDQIGGSLAAVSQIAAPAIIPSGSHSTHRSRCIANAPPSARLGDQPPAVLPRPRFASSPVSDMSVVTRFAPSPTGFLHIGGARTALFNWLFARAQGGKYLLRIEDTDRARSTDEAIAAIFEGLDWLGLKADGDPIFQFARAERHRAATEEMIARGAAFRCYATAEEMEALRAVAHAEGRAVRSPWRDGGARQDASFTVRLRAPDDGDILNADLVQGDVRIKARDLDDLVLLRADGNPTYMLSVVVDDHDMGVTHVIRGDDHLTNAARQIPIYQAMGWTPPLFAHIPLIHGPDGAKLSKRHGALAVQGYRDMGYLPEALNAYLMRLGWSPGHDDILSKEEAIGQFDLAQIGKAPARLDFAKLDSVNAHFLRVAEDGRLAPLLFDHIVAHKGWTLSPTARASVEKAVSVLKNRAKTLAEMADQAGFLISARPLNLDAKAQSLVKEAKERLKRLRERLIAEPKWENVTLSLLLKAFATDEGVGMGQIGPPLRAALTGGAPSPDLGQTLELLGRDETLARLADQV